MKILIIEDDLGIANSLKLYLWGSGFEIDLLHTWKTATETILSNNYDLVILDINLPEKDWITICSEVRATSRIPIVMLTARSSQIDKIEWLENWADDYISKPFSPRELLARINTILRRAYPENTKQNILKFSDIEIIVDKNIVQKAWVEIPLTKNEFDILKAIIESDWNIVSRETLMIDIMWYDNYMFDRTIDTHIKNIRKKLWDKEIILTIRWKWYRLDK